jgi:hypothetical protein
MGDATSSESRVDNLPRRWASATASTGLRLGGTSKNVDSETPVTALLFWKRTMSTWRRGIAESHPGLRFGASVDVRPWTVLVRVPRGVERTVP